MDYVVYGTGYGATLMVLGYAIRTWGPGWRFRDGEEAAYDRREFQTARSAWTRFTNGLGTTVATAGAVLVLLTFILMLINPGDDMGSTIALVVTGLLLVGIAVWAWMFFDRFGAWGVVATPNALSSYEPAHYDSRAAQPVAVALQDATADADADGAEEPVDELEEGEVEEVGDDSDLAARSTKFQLHHPEDADGTDEDADTTVDESEEWFEAQYSKYESHHPEGVDAPDPVDGDENEDEDIGEYVEALTPEEVTEEIVDEADEEPVGDGNAAARIESYEDLVRRKGPEGGEDIAEADVDAAEDDALEVLPDAHEIEEPLLGEDQQAEAREESGGRDDALRRLRERQAERARQRANDDA